MADYCYIKMRITGEERNLKILKEKSTSLKKAYKGEVLVFDFDKLIPSPKRIEDCEEKYLINEHSHVQIEADRPWFNWYRWNNEHWGTKWNACESHVELYYDRLEIEFSTAWGVPQPVLNVFYQLAANLNLLVKTKITSDYDNKTYYQDNTNYSPSSEDPTKPKPKKEITSIVDDEFTDISKKKETDEEDNYIVLKKRK